ncbi:MAG: hypothetical protein CL566_04990 [Alphaproteobacteria bacterium]|nr:hypothetical protein [Alphaproteobacteria bacterium]|tara:strand:+ start:420 stop:1430 length:1011 start_codon:yes stop_codon:yes gene_type:complete
MGDIIRNFGDYKRAALAVTAVGVVALYGAAIAYPVDRPAREALDWIALPQVEFSAESDRPAIDDGDMVRVATADDLRDMLEAADYDLRPVRRGHTRVPRLFVERLPENFDEEMVVDERKRVFIRTILPLVLKVNEEVRAERRRLVALEEQILSGRDISDSAETWLSKLAEKYDVASGDFAELLRRVDMVSPTLALAQAIEESGWGRSRFARHGNALFGQRAWSQGAGFVPEERAEGAQFEVRAFASLLDSVRSYVVNLNRHYAYDDYRIARANMRAGSVSLDGRELAKTLVSYSERREAYVEALLGLIRTNRLDQFEVAKLSTEPFDADAVQLASR